MDEIKKYIMEIMQDTDGAYSFKRIATLICVILLAVGFIADLFWGFKISEFIYNSVSYIVMAGLGFVGAEKFAPKNKE